MKLKELKIFLEECYQKGVIVPQNIRIGIEDFKEVVPEDYAISGEYEYNHVTTDRTMVRVIITKQF